MLFKVYEKNIFFLLHNDISPCIISASLLIRCRQGEKQKRLKVMEKKASKSRQGKHPDHYVMLGGMVPPKKKAIAMVTAAVVAGQGKLNVLDLLWRGVENIARTVGVLDTNGDVSAQYRDAVNLAEYTISENQRNYRARKGAKNA